MKQNRILTMIENYGKEVKSSRDMNVAEAMNIIDASESKMEIALNSYLYGHMKATYDNGNTKLVPLYNLRQMTDEEWTELAKKKSQSQM